MGFRKEFVIYENKNTRVYINQCYAKGKKTKVFAVRRDDKKGCARYLGSIEFSGAWRQYVFCPEPETKWSSGCKKKMCEFEDMLNKQWKEGLKKTSEKRRKTQ